MKNPVLEAGIAFEPGSLLLSFNKEAMQERDLLVIGTDEGTTLAIRADGAVVSAEPTTHELVRFVNSSAPAFAGCIAAYQVYGDAVAGCASETEEQACVVILESTIRDLDCSALSDPNHWWSCIVEQARDGLL